MKILKRALALATLSVMAAAGTAAAAPDQNYPNRPVTVVIPQGPGGANDIIGRIVLQKLSEELGQPFIVDNRPGAGGNIGTAAAAKARNDGYTLLLTTNSTHVISPAIYKNPGFDSIQDFEPVGPIATAGYVLVANKNFPGNDVTQLIELAKAEPDRFTIASAGNGTLNHLIGEMLKKAAGIELLHVPYGTASAAVSDLVGGQVDLSVQSLPSSLSFIRNGQLKVLGVVNDTRFDTVPDVPTIGETIEGFGSTPWYGIFAPAGTPEPVVERLQAALAKVLAMPDTREQLAAVGCEPFIATSQEFSKLVSDDLVFWAQVVKESGARLD